MKKLNTVIFTANTSWFISNFYESLILKFKNQGCSVYVVAPYDASVPKLIEYGCKCIDLPLDSKGSNPINDLKTLFSYLKIYFRIRPDLVLNFTIKPNMYSTLPARILGTRVVNTVTGLGTVFIGNSLATIFAKLLYRFTQPFANQICILNSDDMKLLLDLGLTPKKKTVLVPGSGVDVDKFQPLQQAMQSEHFVFLYLGRILSDKGLYELVEAIRLLKSQGYIFECQWQGYLGVQNRTAIPEDQVYTWEREGLIRFMGPTDDVRSAIAGSDCVVLPSYREGLPQSLLEASAMEKMIIATDVPGCRDVVLDGCTGFLCEVKNPAHLADSMLRAMSLSMEQRRLMGCEGRQWVKSRFSTEIVHEYYLNQLKLI